MKYHKKSEGFKTSEGFVELGAELVRGFLLWYSKRWEIAAESVSTYKKSRGVELEQKMSLLEKFVEQKYAEFNETQKQIKSRAEQIEQLESDNSDK